MPYLVLKAPFACTRTALISYLLFRCWWIACTKHISNWPSPILWANHFIKGGVGYYFVNKKYPVQSFFFFFFLAQLANKKNPGQCFDNRCIIHKLINLFKNNLHTWNYGHISSAYIFKKIILKFNSLLKLTNQWHLLKLSEIANCIVLWIGKVRASLHISAKGSMCAIKKRHKYKLVLDWIVIVE